MKTFELKGSFRKDTGKRETKNLRKQELVPCVIYGGEKNLHFAAIEKDLRNLIYTPDVYLVKLDIDGDKHDAVIKEVQFHPVTDQILHVDFSEVVSGKTVVISLPIKLTGSSAGLLAGGKLRQRRRTMKVKGLVEHMPDQLEVDITHLEIGDSLKIGDLEYDNLEVLDPTRAMVVGVVSSRLVAKGLRELVEEEEAVEEGVEGMEDAAAATEEEAAPSEEAKEGGE